MVRSNCLLWFVFETTGRHLELGLHIQYEECSIVILSGIGCGLKKGLKKTEINSGIPKYSECTHLGYELMMKTPPIIYRR